MTIKPKADFSPTLTLTDFRGQKIKLADYLGRKHVVLVFNRSFM